MSLEAMHSRFNTPLCILRRENNEFAQGWVESLRFFSLLSHRLCVRDVFTCQRLKTSCQQQAEKQTAQRQECVLQHAGRERERERVNEGVRAREHRAGGTLSVSQTALKSLSGRAAVF